MAIVATTPEPLHVSAAAFPGSLKPETEDRDR